jgi:hypothetical protein
MLITHDIRLDLVSPGILPPVAVVQGDTNTRQVRIELYAAGQPWEPPAGAYVVARYSKSDGTTGRYDTLPDGSQAWEIDGNAVTMILCPQMLTVPGKVHTQLSIIDGEQELSTFTITVDVAADPSKGATASEDYINDGSGGVSQAQLATKLPQPDGEVQVGHYLKVAEVDAKGRVVRLEGAAVPSGGSGEGSVTAPAYWMTALNNGAQAINTALLNAGRNKSAFLFYTDAHWDGGGKAAPALLEYLHRHTGMAKTFFGGDIVSTEGTDYDTMSYLWDWRKQIKELPNHHSVVGNHDDGNATNNLFSTKYVYGFLFAPEETGDIVRGGDMYYFMDNDSEKTRYLFLDTAYLDAYALSAKQSAWIKDTLKSTPAGWHIVVVAHIWYMPDYDQYSVRPIPITGLSDTAAAVCAILDNYNARSGEFTDCGATVRFCIGGHVHRDYVGTTAGGIPIIVCECAGLGYRGSFPAAVGDTSETAVSGVIADYDADKVTVIRVGRGNSFAVVLSTGDSTGVDNGGPPKPTYTNILDTVGYTEGYRLSGSSGNPSVNAATDITGFIPCVSYEHIYLKNVIMPDTNNNYYAYVAHYDAGKNHLGGYYYYSGMDGGENLGMQWDENGNLTHFRVNQFDSGDVAYIRICAQNIDAASIISVENPIE